MTRAKIAEDEPICEKLRSENNALRAKMFATKEFQTAAVQEVEKLKSEKNALIKRRASLMNINSSKLTDLYLRRRFMVRYPAFRMQSVTRGLVWCSHRNA